VAGSLDAYDAAGPVRQSSVSSTTSPTGTSAVAPALLEGEDDVDSALPRHALRGAERLAQLLVQSCRS